MIAPGVDASEFELIRVGTLLVGVLIGAITAAVALRNQRLSNQQYSTTSFYSALDKLGHAEASVRTGAIYALEHLATYNPKAYYCSVVSALAHTFENILR